jgi:hypothetical protein
MAAPVRLRVSAIAVKIETTSGVDSVPTLAANAIKFKGVPLFNPDFIEKGLRDDVQFGGMGSQPRAAPVGRFAQLAIRMEVRGTGSTYAAGASVPETDPFHRAAGFLATNTGATWTYDPLDDGFETMTTYVWVGKKLFKMVGCVVHQKLSATVSQIGIWDFTVTGVIVSDPIDTTLGAVTHNATIPPQFVNSAVAIGAFNYAAGLMVRSVDLDYPATIVPRSAAGAPDGLLSYVITDRQAQLGMEIEQVALSIFDPYALSRQAGAGGTSTATSIAIGSTAFNRLIVDTGQWPMDPPAMGDGSGLGLWNIAGRLVPGSLGVNGKESRITYS